MPRIVAPPGRLVTARNEFVTIVGQDQGQGQKRFAAGMADYVCQPISVLAD